MELKITTETVHTVDYGDLEMFVESLYGVQPEITAMEETGNDTTLRFSVDGKLDSWDLKKVAELKATGYTSYGTRVMLNMLCAEGHIPAGTYLIRISW